MALPVPKTIAESGICTHSQPLFESAINVAVNVKSIGWPDPARVTVYDLGDWGRGLEAVNTALSLWAVQSPRLPYEADMGPDTLILATRAHARPLPAGSSDRTVALHLTDSRITNGKAATYLAALTSSGTVIDKTFTTDAADANVSSTTLAWKHVIIGGALLDRVEGISVAGHYETVQMLIDATKLQASSGELWRSTAVLHRRW